MEKKDEELMLDFQKGDSRALEEIFHRYKSRILNFAIRMLGNRAEAEDVTGEVFLAFYRSCYSYRPEAKFSTWLFTVARNRCISRIRKNKGVLSLWVKSREGQEAPVEIPDTSQISRDQVLKKEISKEVQMAIAGLPGEQKEAIILREYHHLSYEDISQVLNCSLEKVKILIYRGREQLRTELSSFIKGEK